MAYTALTRILVVALTALLLTATALGASVTTGWSGITPSSHKYTFTYNPLDNKTVIPGVVETDLLVIASKSGSRQYFLKSRLDNTWNYEIMGGAKGLQLRLGEPVDVDLNNDGTPELVMVWTNATSKQGTFVFYKPGTEPVPAPVQAATAGVAQLDVVHPPETRAATQAGAPAATASDAITGNVALAPADAAATPAKPVTSNPSDLGIMTGGAIVEAKDGPQNYLIVGGIGLAILAAIVGVVLMTRRGAKKTDGGHHEPTVHKHSKRDDDEQRPDKLPKIIE